jgi:hypothetical protein
MISEGSCDTEDWRNDAENSALITGINYTFTQKTFSVKFRFLLALAMFLQVSFAKLD